MLYYPFGVANIVISLVLPLSFIYFMLQANVALIGLIEYVSYMDKKQAGRHYCIMNDIKIVTARHLEDQKIH